MNFDREEIRKLFAIFLLATLAVLAFLLVRPVLLAIIAGLILAYIFNPIYQKIYSYTKRKNLSVILVCILVITIIIVPLWFIIPIIIKQVFNLFTASQAIDIHSLLKAVFPTASEDFLIQTATSLDSVISKAASAVLNMLVNFLLDLPNLILQLVIVLFVFFFSLRDSDELINFVVGLSPLRKEQEKAIIGQFKSITYSIIYGSIIIGIIQGLVAGLGFFVFGIPNAFILTILAIFFSIIPVTGAFLIWAPATVYLFLIGQHTSAIIYLVYNVLIVSWIDNVLRVYLLSKQADLSPAIGVIGIIGGLIVFGIMGLVLGPLILAYLITILQAYKDNTLANIF